MGEGMQENKYEVVFYGTLAEGFTKQQTQEHVAQLFKTTIDQVERMFTGSRVVIRNKLDQATALKYIIAMQKRGAECQIEGMGDPGVKITFDSVTAAPSEPVAETNSEATAQTAPEVKPSAVPQDKPAQPREKNQDGLPVAGEKVNEILSSTNFSLDPTGVRLSEDATDEEIDLPNLDNLSIAPVGSDLVSKKEEIPVALPDISHLSVEPPNQ